MDMAMVLVVFWRELMLICFVFVTMVEADVCWNNEIMWNEEKTEDKNSPVGLGRWCTHPLYHRIGPRDIVSAGLSPLCELPLPVLFILYGEISRAPKEAAPVSFLYYNIKEIQESVPRIWHLHLVQILTLEVIINNLLIASVWTSEIF